MVSRYVLNYKQYIHQSLCLFVFSIFLFLYNLKPIRLFSIIAKRILDFILLKYHTPSVVNECLHIRLQLTTIWIVKKRQKSGSGLGDRTSVYVLSSMGSYIIWKWCFCANSISQNFSYKKKKYIWHNWGFEPHCYNMKVKKDFFSHGFYVEGVDKGPYLCPIWYSIKIVFR